MITKTILLILLFWGSSFKTHAQTLGWAKGFGGDQNDNANFISVDASGNVYTVGEFEDKVDFNPGSGSFFLPSKGNNDIFVHKMDASGNFIWARSFGNQATDYATGLVLDKSGNLYITGAFSISADFDPGSGTFELNSAGGTDVFVLKLNPSGDLIWARSFGGANNEYGNFITLDADENIYITGNFAGTADFDPGAGTANLTANGGNDIFVQKLDPSGNFLWAKSFGGSGEDYGYAVNVDASGNVLTTGFFSETVDFDPGTGITSLTTIGNADVFVQKLDATGNFIWARTFGGNNSEVASSILTDASGNVYTAGNFLELVDFDPGAGTHDITSAGNRDVFIQKLDASGNFVWVKTFGGSSEDKPRGLKMDASGNLYCAGVFYSTADFDPGPGTANLTSKGFADNFVQKLDPAGDFLWAIAFGGVAEEQMFEIHVDALNTLYTTGAFSGTADFDPGAGTANLSAAGGNDVFVQKMTQSTTGSIHFGENINVSVSPNPCTELVNVCAGKAMNNVELTVADLEGKMVFEKRYEVFDKEELKLEGRSGIYFLTIKTAGIRSVVKLIKE